MYINWKFDNIGKSIVDGKYKLFDFDASGITDDTNSEWLIEPVKFFNYKSAQERNVLLPIDIDNFCFETYLVKEEN